KVKSSVLDSAKGQFVDRHVLQRRDKLWIQRQGLLELLVRLFPPACPGESDSHQIASFEVVWRAIQDLLQEREGQIKLSLLHKGHRSLVVRVLRPGRANARRQPAEQPRSRQKDPKCSGA